MGREVTTVDTAPVWYVPDIDGNREDPEPFRVLLSPLTAGDMARARHAMHAKAIRAENAGDDDAVDDAARAMIERLLAGHVLEVANYAARNATTGEVTHPKNGRELVAAELATAPTLKSASPTLDDIWEALQTTSKLNEGVSGNFERRPDSSEPPTTGAPTPESDTVSTMSTESSGAATLTIPGIQISPESSETSADAPGI